MGQEILIILTNSIAESFPQKAHYHCYHFKKPCKPEKEEKLDHLPSDHEHQQRGRKALAIGDNLPLIKYSDELVLDAAVGDDRGSNGLEEFCCTITGL